MSSSAPMSECCVSGFKHEGDAVGEMTEVGGIKSYITYPKDKSTENAVLYLPDAFGLELINGKLLADEFAHAGYLTVIPDYFAGDPVPERVLTEGMGSFDIVPWLASHSPTQVDPIIEATIKGMKQDLGVKNIGVVGYCFGGKYVIRFLAEGKGIRAGFLAHPNFPSQEEMEQIAGPLSCAFAETDFTVSPENRHALEEVLLKKSNPYQTVLYGDCEHGFAVRADLKDPNKKFAKESAYYQAVRWFDEHVKKPKPSS